VEWGLGMVWNGVAGGDLFPSLFFFFLKKIF